MAFNPFHSFRRYSKVVFAGLAILCMFTFVLSSGMGQGDFFSQLADMFGGGGGSGSTVVTVHGKKFDAREFDTIQNQRRLANMYMEQAVSASHAFLERRVSEAVNRIDQADRGILQREYFQRYSAILQNQFQQLMQHRQQLLAAINYFEGQKKTELASALGLLAKLEDLDLTVFVLRSGQHYFGSVDKLDDTVNFLVWRHEADKMGIRLSDENISDVIKDETRGEFTQEAAQAVEQNLRQRGRGGFSPEALFAAIGEELRVRIAQVALTGSAIGVGRHTLSAVPNPLTPQESWQLFKDARTTVKVGLIDVPVRDFIPKVTDTPAEDELKKLFEKHKGDEPAPDRADPGFKDPRKIQVTWVGGGPDLPFYQTAADRVLELAPALRLLGNTAPASALLVPLQRDAEVLSQEKAIRDREPKWWESQYTPGVRLRETSVQRAENVAATIGASLGAFGTGGAAPLTGPLAMQAAALRRETEDAAKFFTSAIGLAAGPDAVTAVFGAPVAGMPKVTLDQLRSQLLQNAKTELLTGGPAGRFDRGTTPFGLVASDLHAFRGEVMKLGREKKSEVEKYVTEFVQKRGLLHSQSAEPRDVYHLGDDAGMAPLKDAYRKSQGDRDLLLRQFAQEFFTDHAQRLGTPDGVFIPHKYFTAFGDDKQYYWWRTEDVPAKTPRYDKARPAVVEAWKLLKARDEAKKEAERLQDLVKRAQGDPARLRDIAAQNGNREYFDLGPIAQYMPQINPTAMGEISRDYATLRPGITPEQIAQVYHVTADKVAYPDADMVQTLLNLREKEKGATAVVTDKPKQHYYAASLLDRQEPTTDDFRPAYKGSMARAGAERDPLLAHLARGRTDEYRKAVLDQLRAEAKVAVNESARRGDQ